MTLPAGKTVGPYEVLGPLGSGGMGEVYRARDTRLGRTVAIKVVRSQLSGNDDLRMRFEREARAISSLSHPHICTLYDVGRDGDSEYLVMEVLEGEPLSAKIARGPLPVSQVLRYGAQIADALDHAHRAGVVHRDLKPANIMITAGGAKLLDFGLAKLAETPARIFSEHSAPATENLTAEGAIVGTFQYMSPEQIEGKPLDHRSDMFALGIVLYEMTTGRRPFGGASPASIIASLLSSDPAPVRSLQPEVPAELERIILTALEKNPADRWQSAQDVARQLRWLADSSSNHAAVPAHPRRGRWRIAAAFAATAIAAALLTWLAARTFTPHASHRSLRLQLAPPDGIVAAAGLDTNNFAISPDGKRLLFLGYRQGKRVLFVRAFDAGDVSAVEGSEDAIGPFWSPDSAWIGFAAHGKLWKTNLAEHGSPIPLCNVAVNGAVATWSHGVILLSDAPGSGQRRIMRIPDSGGVPQPVTTIDTSANEWRHTWPLFLPDGKHFLYQTFTVDSTERRLMMKSLDGSETAQVIANVSRVALVGDSLLYVRDGTLLMQKFDASRGAVSGEPVTMASNVRYFYATAGADFDASPDGVIVYRTSTSNDELVEVDRSGNMIRRLGEGEAFFTVNVSPDGRRAAVSIMNRGTGLGDIWIYDLARGVRDRFTGDPGMEVYPLWSPDGNSIIYSRTGGGILPYLVRTSMNAPGRTNITEPGFFDVANSFSPDGATLYFTRRDPRTSSHIFRLTLANKRLEGVLDSGFRESSAQVSPDGRWLAFTTDATGTTETYVQELAAPDRPRIRISTNGGLVPRWASNGELLFVAGRQIVSATPDARSGWNDPIIKPLFALQAELVDYAPARSGSILVCRSTPSPGDELFNVIVRD